MNLNQKAKELTDSIKGTREFMELKQAKANIDKNKDLKIQVEEFVKKQTELFTSNKPGKEAESKAAELNKKFETLSKIPEVDKFLKAGKVFNDMMVRTYKSVSDSLESELKS